MTLEYINQELQTLKEKKNYRSLPPLIHEGRDVLLNGQRMLNLSSNDYLGLANDISLREEFLRTLTPETFLPTSSSSRLLTGNFSDYQKLEQQLATMFGTESALIFNSGYHANTGILPTFCTIPCDSFYFKFTIGLQLSAQSINRCTFIVNDDYLILFFCLHHKS